MKSLVLSAVVAVAAVLGQQSAAAASTIDPRIFALSPTDFPAGSQVIRSRIESNRLLPRDRVLHFGKPFGKEGRLTGYFMEAVEGNRSLPRVDTHYLVSIFATAEQASGAFAEQRYYWSALGERRAQSVPLRTGQYGDPGAEGLYSFEGLDNWAITELFFRRGPVLVEVFQALRVPHPSHDDVQSFESIGKKLDVIARVCSSCSVSTGTTATLRG